MEFLIATAALTFREEGARFVSLSGAPLARLDRGERPSALQRLLDMIASTLEPAYGFQSLLHFKAKFQPVYQPLYLTYPDPAALGSIATAIGRAYVPRLTPRQALRLLTMLRWPHANRGPASLPNSLQECQTSCTFTVAARSSVIDTNDFNSSACTVTRASTGRGLTASGNLAPARERVQDTVAGRCSI